MHRSVARHCRTIAPQIHVLKNTYGRAPRLPHIPSTDAPPCNKRPHPAQHTHPPTHYHPPTHPPTTTHPTIITNYHPPDHKHLHPLSPTRPLSPPTHLEQRHLAEQAAVLGLHLRQCGATPRVLVMRRKGGNEEEERRAGGGRLTTPGQASGRAQRRGRGGLEIPDRQTARSNPFHLNLATLPHPLPPHQHLSHQPCCSVPHALDVLQGLFSDDDVLIGTRVHLHRGATCACVCGLVTNRVWISV